MRRDLDIDAFTWRVSALPYGYGHPLCRDGNTTPPLHRLALDGAARVLRSELIHQSNPIVCVSDVEHVHHTLQRTELVLTCPFVVPLHDRQHDPVSRDA